LIDLFAPPPVSEVQSRLKLIFPEGTPHRAASVSDVAAKTVFVLLYVGAIDGKEQWIRPDQVTRMTDAQAAMQTNEQREAWLKLSMASSSKQEIPGRWYAPNSREGIRDDTIKNALVPNGVVLEKPGVSTTSGSPRWSLQASFASLFDPALTGDALETAAANWRQDNLSTGALARIMLRLGGAVATGDHVLVKFPSGETRSMAVGDSSLISKAVIEDFAQRFLQMPAVVFLSESRTKVTHRDDNLAKKLGLHIQADKNLPDIILADIGPKHPLLIFVEVVATDGPITAERRAALAAIAKDAKFPEEHVAFVTAYLDRSEAAFKKTVDQLAWGSFAWFVSEPESIVQLIQGQPQAAGKLSELLH
jgi:hypothetical protein